MKYRRWISEGEGMEEEEAVNEEELTLCKTRWPRARRRSVVRSASRGVLRQGLAIIGNRIASKLVNLVYGRVLARHVCHMLSFADDFLHMCK